jgi:alkanesulfonate monooxygenase SsuD/methylene tetrahydromethanopterin reductase-like flavin-dependent oxidoreductase (luciferase family)
MLTTEQRDELAARRGAGRLKFGNCVPAFAMPGPGLFRLPNVSRIEDVDVLAHARTAERLGFDSIWVCDHLMLGHEQAVLEGWTTLAAIAGATSRAQLGLIHQANLFRHPAIAAKMMATLDRLSGGRFIHFFEAGMGRAEQVAYGLDWDDDHTARVRRLEEAMDLIEALYAATAPIDFNGEFYHVTGARLEPKPVQQAVPLWLGEAFEPVIELTARRADGWNSTPVSLPELDRRLGLLDAALAIAGRTRAELEISFETQVLVAPDLAGLRAKVGGLVERSRASGAGEPSAEIADFLAGRTDEMPETATGPWIIGTPEAARARIVELRRRGVDHLMLWFMDAPETDGMELFMSEVASAFR